MSTIFGICRPGKAAVLPEELDRMRHAMAHWETDKEGSWLSGAAGFGHLLLHNTPESLHEAQPLVLGNLVLAADARVDNREDIARKLGDPQLDPETTDPEYLLAMISRFGLPALADVRGDFALALWDTDKQEMVCVRDQMGVKNLFYSVVNGQLLFASEPRGILAHPEADRTIDTEFVDCLLEDMDPDPAQTFHRSIRRLLPGQYLRFSTAGLELHRYWQPVLPDIVRYSSTTQYIEHFQSELLRAVSRRMRSLFPVGVELSGGLDSSGVTALAAAARKGGDRLISFSNVLAPDASGQKPYRDEESFIDSVIHHCDIREVVKVSGSGRPHPLAYHDLELRVNNGVDVYSAWWQEPLRAAMEQQGVRTALSGYGGDEGVTQKAREYYRDYLREGQLWDYLKVVHARRNYGQPFAWAARKILPSGWINRMRDRPQPQGRQSYAVSSGTNGHKKRVHSPQPVPGSFRQQVLHLLTRDYTFQRIQSEGLFAIPHRIEVRYPLLDLDLVQAYLSFPLHIIGHPQIDRYLFREAMRRYLPESVRTRQDKRVSAGIYYLQEARENAPFFLEWLKARQAAAESEWSRRVDLDKMLRGWDPAFPGNYRDGNFIPKGSFRAEALLRFEESIGKQGL